SADDGSPGAAVLAFVDEEGRLQTLLPAKLRTDIAVRHQRHSRAVGQWNQSGLEVLSLSDMKDALIEVYVFNVQPDQFTTPQPGYPKQSDQSGIRVRAQ